MNRTSALLIAAVAFGVTAAHAALAHAAAPRYAAQDSSLADWMERLEPVLLGFAPDPSSGSPSISDEFDWRHKSAFQFKSLDHGPTVNLADIPGGGGLMAAARAYTLSSGDLSATVGEIVDAGWWPYDTIPAEFDLGLYVSSGEMSNRIFDKSFDLKNIGSPQWVVRFKNDIASEFYKDFFFRRGTPHRTADELPAQLAQFWVNPVTGAPAVVSEAPGDLRISSVNYSVDFVGATPGAPSYGGSNVRQKLPADERRDMPSFNYHYAASGQWARMAGQAAPELPPHVRSQADYRSFGAEMSRRDPDLSAVGAEYQAGLLGIMLESQLPGDRGTFYAGVSFNDSGERAPLETLACPLALQLAAQYYALATLDNQVSLRDLVDSGFWPYDTFPQELDLSETLYDFPREVKCDISFEPEYRGPNGEVRAAGFSGLIANGLGTRTWLLWRKAEILNQAHQELYFMPHSRHLPAQGVDAATQDVLPRFNAFWHDVLRTTAAGSLEPARFGQQYGELSLVDVNFLRPQFEGARVSYQQQVPLFNLTGKQALDYMGKPVVPCALVIERTVDIGGVEQSAAWRMPSEAGGGIGEVRFIFDQPTQRTEHVLLDFGWVEQQYVGLTPAEAVAAYGRRSWGNGVCLVPQGASSANVSFSGTGIYAMTDGRILFDSVALLRVKYGMEWAVPGDYWFVSSAIAGGLVNQGPAVPVGVDWLAEPETTTLAGLD